MVPWSIGYFVSSASRRDRTVARTVQLDLHFVAHASEGAEVVGKDDANHF